MQFANGVEFVTLYHTPGGDWPALQASLAGVKHGNETLRLR